MPDLPLVCPLPIFLKTSRRSGAHYSPSPLAVFLTALQLRNAQRRLYRGKYFDDEGYFIGENKPYDLTGPPGTRIMPAYTPGGRKECFEKLLSKVFNYEPKDRIRASELVEELTQLIPGQRQFDAAREA